jgi:hypothetical protein
MGGGGFVGLRTDLGSVEKGKHFLLLTEIEPSFLDYLAYS